MESRHFLACVLLVAAALYACPSARAQAVLDKTTFGQSQNSSQDLQNSLVPGKPNLTKGEKKAEVDPRTLQSKPIKDPLFQGGLMDVDVDWSGDKLGKPRTNNQSDSKVQKQSETVDKNSKSAAKDVDTSADKDSKGSKSEAAGDQKKEPKQGSTKSDDKSSEKEKSGQTAADR
jgi:hypothetical protein